jgi:hypothetical protein
MGKAMKRRWETEPNRMGFEYLNFKCSVAGYPTLKHLCGCVAMSKGHPYYEEDYDQIDADVHGGPPMCGILDHLL